MKRLPNCSISTQDREDNTVIVIWRDAVSHASWLDPEEAKNYKPAINRTKGKLLSEDEDCVRVFMSWNETDIGDLTIIPRENVVKIVR